MIYAEGTEVTDEDYDMMAGRSLTTYSDIIPVTPNVIYSIRLEVLQSGLGGSNKKVWDIKFDDNKIGACNLPGPGNSCHFHECGSAITLREISSTSGKLVVDLRYSSHSHECDCDKMTWDCNPKGNIAGRSNIVAAARVILTPTTKLRKGTHKLLLV